MMLKFFIRFDHLKNRFFISIQIASQTEESWFLIATIGKISNTIFKSNMGNTNTNFGNLIAILYVCSEWFTQHIIKHIMPNQYTHKYIILFVCKLCIELGRNTHIHTHKLSSAPLEWKTFVIACAMIRTK